MVQEGSNFLIKHSNAMILNGVSSTINSLISLNYYNCLSYYYKLKLLLISFVLNSGTFLLAVSNSLYSSSYLNGELDGE